MGKKNPQATGDFGGLVEGIYNLLISKLFFLIKYPHPFRLGIFTFPFNNLCMLTFS
jgi:hypothetical protein